MLHAAVESYILDTVWHGPDLTQDQQNAVEDAIEYFHTLEKTTSGQKGYELHVEERVYLKEYHPSLYECSGTCDILIKTATELHVLDWKFGQGIPVFAQDNDQLYAYAAGAAKNHQQMMEYERIFIHCIQPRLDSYDVYELTPKELMQWVNGRLIPGCTAATGLNPEFIPGQKQCRWCPAKTKCRARYNMANQTAADVFAAVEKMPDEVSKEELAKLYSRSKELTQYIKDIGTLMFEDIQRGIPWPGYKIVRGRSLRKWKDDPTTTIEALTDWLDYDELFTQKLVSPAQAEKKNRALKKDLAFQDLIEKPEGKPTLVEESDKRPAVDYRTVEQIFSEKN